MKSLRTKITLLTVCAIVAAMTVATSLSVIAIRHIGSSSSDQMLLLLCESGSKNLDFYFKSVEQSVAMISTYVESDLNGLKVEEFPEHLERVKNIFRKMSYLTNGVLTYYYRIDPDISKNAKGFWFVNLDGEGFKEHEVTDITLYDTKDTSKLVWFTVPKSTGKAIWLPPYITENLGVRVISYNVPIFWDKKFIGVVGIEIDYSIMAEQVNRIKFFDNGYAFLNDSDGKIIYHPYIDITKTEIQSEIPEALKNNDTFNRYKFKGVEKRLVRQPLTNGMRLNVTVPVSEINGDWEKLILNILVFSVILLVFFISLTMHLSEHITNPLRELTNMAEEVNNGNYEIKLNYDGNDEVGILTRTFNKLISNLKIHIGDLNNLAYADALTSLRNKGACDTYTEKLQNQINESNGEIEFAIGISDCNNLKLINDLYGHDKGDIYLKNSSALICKIFQHSPVFRTGGDEFTIILQNEDFQNREKLIRILSEKSIEISKNTEKPWEKISVAIGIAEYNPKIDSSVGDVMRRADKLMYEHKRKLKTRKKPYR